MNVGSCVSMTSSADGDVFWTVGVQKVGVALSGPWRYADYSVNKYLNSIGELQYLPSPGRGP